jgi:hypothetical protein
VRASIPPIYTGARHGPGRLPRPGR